VICWQALDKIRFLSLTDQKVLGDTPALEIKVQIRDPLFVWTQLSLILRQRGRSR
jgi:hypothetical protein